MELQLAANCKWCVFMTFKKTNKLLLIVHFCVVGTLTLVLSYVN